MEGLRKYVVRVVSAGCCALLLPSPVVLLGFGEEIVSNLGKTSERSNLTVVCNCSKASPETQNHEQHHSIHSLM